MPKYVRFDAIDTNFIFVFKQFPDSNGWMAGERERKTKATAIDFRLQFVQLKSKSVLPTTLVIITLVCTTSVKYAIMPMDGWVDGVKLISNRSFYWISIQSEWQISKSPIVHIVSFSHSVCKIIFETNYFAIHLASNPFWFNSFLCVEKDGQMESY